MYNFIIAGLTIALVIHTRCVVYSGHIIIFRFGYFRYLLCIGVFVLVSSVIYLFRYFLILVTCARLC